MNNLNPSRNLAARPRARCFLALFLLAGWPAMTMTQAAGLAATNTPAAIPWNEIGVKAGAAYQGDGLAVTPTGPGARLHCVFQRLDGEATPEGLWLTSTVTNTVSDRFRVTAMAVGRLVDFGVRRQSAAATPLFDGGRLDKVAVASESGVALCFPPQSKVLPAGGIICLAGQTVRFSRPGLTEEYSVSMDGVRQDFIVEQAPASSTDGELVVKLAVSGAQVEPAADGARLVLAHSGRKIAYSRLRVTDATGKELPARIEVCPVGDEVTSLNSWIVGDKDIEEKSLLTSAPTGGTLAVVVNDAEAVYPVRIDPTFSDANWVSMGGFPGANGEVYAAVIDGSGNLYIGGDFTEVGNIFANYIAQWNGSSWSALGSGMSYDVYALAVSGSTLFAGGGFWTAGGSAANDIAQWNGSSWSALGSGMDNHVFALAVSGSTLFAGGNFTMAGGSAATGIAQWNGSSWSALGSGIGGGYVIALAVSGSTLFAGGNFTTAGVSAANNIAQWNGSSWSPLGSGLSGGQFGSDVTALAVAGSTLYAGGFFTTAGGNAANNIAQWNGSSWSALGSGMNGGVQALAVSGSTLYAGGDFATAGGSAAHDIAQWNGSSWSALGSGIFGLNLSVSALAVSGSTVYAGGYFTTAGGGAANYIAQWNGSSWSALGSGMGADYPYVYALAVSGSTLYAGGIFTTAGGSAANLIAQWNGSSWSALGSGMSGLYGSGEVSALAVSGGTLYAGGQFTLAGGVAATNIAQWNGSSWSALGSGIGDEHSTVSALAVSGGTLYAGGQFTLAEGGVAATNIAQWNGSSWSALGSGIGDYDNGDTVFALAVSGGTLYAGGFLTTAGSDTNANNIAQWNGSSWSALGSGMNSTVYALAVSGGTLYAGGYFTTAGSDTNANYIAQWNGSSWSALGSGISGGQYGPSVFALAVSGSTLYAGGSFTTAGTNGSAYAALAYLPVPPTLSIIADGANMVLTWPDVPSGYTTGYTLESATSLVPPVAWQTNYSAPIVIGGQNVIINPITGPQQFFRLFNP